MNIGIALFISFSEKQKIKHQYRSYLLFFSLFGCCFPEYSKVRYHEINGFKWNTEN